MSYGSSGETKSRMNLSFAKIIWNAQLCEKISFFAHRIVQRDSTTDVPWKFFLWLLFYVPLNLNIIIAFYRDFIEEKIGEKIFF